MIFNVQINEFTGYWRSFGFGMLAIYKSDFSLLPGFSDKIKGWGEEDIDLANKVIIVAKGFKMLENYDF